MLKQFWLKKGAGLFMIGIFAGLLFAVIRTMGTIGPSAYRFVLPLGFIIMMLMPFLFLNKEGRRKIGLRKSNDAKYYLIAIAAGTALALVCYGLGWLLFGLSADNWLVNIKSSNFNTLDTTGKSIILLFIIFMVLH